MEHQPRNSGLEPESIQAPALPEDSVAELNPAASQLGQPALESGEDDMAHDQPEAPSVRPQGPPIIPRMPRVETKSGESFVVFGGVLTISVKKSKK